MPGLEVVAAALGLANSALDGILKRTAISDRVAAQLGVESDLAFIRDEFAMMQAFLKTAEKAKRRATKRGKVVDTWARQVRVLAYDVEDCLEDSALHLERRQWSSCRRLRRTVKARHRIARTIKKLRARVEDVSNRRSRYGLINDIAPPSQPTPAAELPRAIGDHDLWSSAGEQPDTRDDHGRASVSIVKEAYDHPETQNSGFTWRAWVKVAHPFNPHEFVKSLVMQFYDSSIQRSGAPPAVVVGIEVMNKMEKTMAEGRSSSVHEDFVMLMKQNKYLFVLDDLADVEEWIWIKTYLPDYNKNGSRIIVPTQHKEIAMLCLEQPISINPSVRFSV
ncbi:hypothetical protein BAE44_0007548 [Dichanthelium oligosanthes]|uniref:Rx N-terminal domain-containing protein n=1 Tax=Dichanthelium oligosanthes TaxID=888268 RepID=A0A1E5W248_9POAL|nr:hypothetical protein BAE44_0007548 [Dichanthelium oligosanthes]